MLRTVKTLGCLALLAFGLQSAKGFALLGPLEAWQTAPLGFQRMIEIAYPGDLWTIFRPDFTFAPKNIDEFYRWTAPTLYYTYDPTFLGYFQAEGVQAVDSAFAILNALTNVDSYSRDFSEFPLDEARFNYTASALHLFDLKSATLEMVLTRLGLADPEHWTWLVKERVLPPGAQCPLYDFTVVQRNFDPVALTTSKYVNGNLYTYQILITCPPAPDLSYAQEFLVDPLDTYATAVASPKVSNPNILYYGMFHSGLTRDDIGGLHYLYSTNRVQVEPSPPDALLFQTNLTTTLLVSSNLALLAAQSLTNDAPTLSTLFPGLVVISSTNSFTNVFTTNLTAYFTNFPFDPFGTPPRIAFVTNVTGTVLQIFQHTFGNLITFSNTPGGGVVPIPLTTLPGPTNPAPVTILTTVVAFSNSPFAPFGSTLLTTNNTAQTYLTNSVVGEYVLLPTNLCSVDFLYSQLTFTNAVTNVLVSATNNLVISTNAFGSTNAGTILFFQQNIVSYYTNHAFVVYPVTCETNTVGLRQGLQKISFVRHDYDSLFNRFFYPITNNYSVVAFTNSVSTLQHFQRIVTRPDIVIAAADLLNDIPNVPTVDHINSSPIFTNLPSPITPAPAGPGVIEGPYTLTFNKAGPVHLNTGPFLTDEESSILYFIWGSFDGSTNAPTIYGGTSLTDLSQQILITVSPSFLDTATQGNTYAVTLKVTGGQAPYTWSMGPGSPDLPQGVLLHQNPADSSQAFLSGTPLVPGTYRFWIRVTDFGGRFIDQNYSLVVESQ
jgi:hypothetical protein